MSEITGFRLSPQQARLWSVQAAGPAERFRAQAALRLEGRLDVALLQHALADLVARHEILRTAYERLPGTQALVQVPMPPQAPALEQLDWSGEPGEEQLERLEALLDSRGQQPLPLDGKLTALLLTLAEGRHLLVLELPALSADMRSLALLVRSLGQAYAARLQGATLPDAGVQYADVAEIFHQLLEDPDTASGREHWRALDTAALAAATLPSERPAAPASLFPPRSLRRRLGSSTTAAVGALAARAATSPSTVLLACWQLLLCRLSGQSAWSVAVSYEGRAYEGLEEALGLFSRYLPLRGELRPRVTFLELLQEVARVRQGEVEWQDYFDPSRNLPAPSVAGHTLPLTFEEVTWPEPMRAGELELSTLRLRRYSERFGLELACYEAEGSLVLELHQDVARYSATEGLRLLERLATLVESAAHHPERPAGELPLVGPEELRRLADFHRTERERPTGVCVHTLLEEQARRTPEAPAVAFEEQQLTFRQLSERSSQLAWHLRSLGVGPEVRVGLYLERSTELMVALFGILKAGGAYVPLDPMYPRERLASVLEQAQAPLVVTHSRLAEDLPEGPVRLCLDTQAEALAQHPTTPPESGVLPGNLAYVLFTSGSTGRPKGVMIEHRSLVNLAASLEEAVYAGLGSGLRVSVNAPLVFDASVKQWLQLLYGRTLYLIPEEVRPDAASLCAFIQRHRLDVLDCTPSLLGPLLNHGLGSEPRSSPARVLVGGEAIDMKTWAELARRPHTRFFNVYGPTECTVDATACEVARAPEPSIGWALGNMSVHLLDERLQPVPLGVRGELFIGGAGVGRGYVGRPDLSAERFIPDPFGPPGSRLYRTGDVGLRREDGRSEFFGRADHQVKLRGFRIELGEIEALLEEQPGVERAAVAVRELQGTPHLVAWFVPKPGTEGASAAAELRSALRRTLPEYMVPSHLVPLERMPLNRSGKLDRGALPTPRVTQSSEGPTAEPTTRAEQTIAAIWRSLLKLDRVDIHANFFDLGGHSLLMVQAHEQLSAAFGRRVSMVELFRYPTVASLASYLAQQLQATGEPGAQATHADTTEDSLEERARRQKLSLQQRRQQMKSGRGKS